MQPARWLDDFYSVFSFYLQDASAVSVANFVADEKFQRVISSCFRLRNMEVGLMTERTIFEWAVLISGTLTAVHVISEQAAQLITSFAKIIAALKSMLPK